MATPITQETLIRDGFFLIKRGDVLYFEKDGLYVIYADACAQWCICDNDGNIGNTYVSSIEELNKELERG